MVEKIIVNPNEIRGYGNILNVHSSTDYDLEDCTIEAGTDTVNGATETVYTLTPTFTPPPTPTYLFYDDCSSSSGLSNYGASECVRGSNASITMTYDSTENAYKMEGSGNYHAFVPIPDLDDEDEYTITAEFKGPKTNLNAQGFFLDNRNDTTSYGEACFTHRYNNEFAFRQFQMSSDGTLHNQTNLNLSGNVWYRIEMTVNGSSLTGKLYDENNTLKTTVTDTLSISNKRMGLFLFCEKGTTSSACYVRNIKAESLSPSPTPTGYSLAFSQDTYITDMLDGVTVSCTLTDDGTPLSGETVTFSWESLGSTSTVTATTNSSGVATHSFEYFDFTSFPATVTATYDTASATCTISDGGGGFIE